MIKKYFASTKLQFTYNLCIPYKNNFVTESVILCYVYIVTTHLFKLAVLSNVSWPLASRRNSSLLFRNFVIRSYDVRFCHTVKIISFIQKLAAIEGCLQI